MRALVSKSNWLLVMFGVGLCTSGIARADDPKFAYGKYEEKKKTEYQLQASAGLLLSTGNANQISGSAALMALRNDGWNKLQLDVSGAYARADTITATDTDASGTISADEIKHTSTLSTALWNSKLRYDRFLTPNNSLYADGFAWGNTPAGKRVVAGAQIGYARQLFKNDMHLLSAELGYDYSFEEFVDFSRYNLHSLRAYVGYTITASKDTAIAVGVEYLGNINSYAGPRGHVGSFGDSRVNGNASLTTRIWKKLAFRLAFTAKYDNVPAPLGKLDGLPFAGTAPAAEKLDTITEASLVMTFL